MASRAAAATSLLKTAAKDLPEVFILAVPVFGACFLAGYTTFRAYREQAVIQQEMSNNFHEHISAGSEIIKPSVTYTVSQWRVTKDGKTMDMGFVPWGPFSNALPYRDHMPSPIVEGPPPAEY
mmetsp:Transcript_11985/g.21257  ORF Transcript_11985/g.21257 Transcript_11985/m.21257 type:complete len:123 (-) Transcript_11985:467-835(-)